MSEPKDRRIRARLAAFRLSGLASATLVTTKAVRCDHDPVCPDAEFHIWLDGYAAGFGDAQKKKLPARGRTR